MGFIEDLFGGQNLELEVRGYFAGSRSTYDAMRMCMHEMVSLKYYSSNLSHKHIDKIRAELFRNAEEQYMRDYYHVAEQRCRVDRDYTFFARSPVNLQLKILLELTPPNLPGL